MLSPFVFCSPPEFTLGSTHSTDEDSKDQSGYGSDEEAVMELSHSLLLNEQALSQVAESKRPIFIYEWLRFLDKVLVAAQKVRQEPALLQSSAVLPRTCITKLLRIVCTMSDIQNLVYKYMKLCMIVLHTRTLTF